MNTLLTNADGRTPVIAKLESNIKTNKSLPQMMKVFKKGKVNPYNKAEYANLDNDSLKKLINFWYGPKRGGFTKFLNFLGFKKPPVPISKWNVSQVTDMSLLFAESKDFNEDISDWDVSNVQNMSNMFKDSELFNRNINDWDVGNVRNMSRMFFNAKAFNMYLDQWNTGRVTDMSYMFYRARKFNRNIESWNVSNVETMEMMFMESNFNKSIEAWNVINVKNMNGMFYNNKKFNQPLFSWGQKLKRIQNVDNMFRGAEKFEQDLSDWNLSKIGVPISMFYDVPNMTNVNYPIGQKVNTQTKNTGLPTKEEKISAERIARKEAKLALDALKEAQEKAERKYDEQKNLYDKKIQDFKRNLEDTQRERNRQIDEDKKKLAFLVAEEKKDLEKSKDLMSKLGVKTGEIRSVEQVTGWYGTEHWNKAMAKKEDKESPDNKKEDTGGDNVFDIQKHGNYVNQLSDKGANMVKEIQNSVKSYVSQYKLKTKKTDCRHRFNVAYHHNKTVLQKSSDPQNFYNWLKNTNSKNNNTN